MSSNLLILMLLVNWNFSELDPNTDKWGGFEQQKLASFCKPSIGTFNYQLLNTGLRLAGRLISPEVRVDRKL